MIQHPLYNVNWELLFTTLTMLSKQFRKIIFKYFFFYLTQFSVFYYHPQILRLKDKPLKYKAMIGGLKINEKAKVAG